MTQPSAALRALPFLLAPAAGAVLTAAFAPYHIHAAAFVALAIHFGLIQRARSGRQAFAIGWLFAVGHHGTALGWIANALLVDATRFAALIPLAKLGIPAYLGLYTGALAWLVFRSRFRDGAAALLFAALWILAEYGRSLLFLPFPWNLAGYVWADVPVISQSVAVLGTPGLGLVTVFLAALLALPFCGVPVRECRPWGQAAALIAALLVACGTVRMVRASNDDQGITLRLVQPNIPQDLKWDPDTLEHNFQRLLDLSRRPADKRLAAIIWPEAAVAWRLDQDTPRRMAAVAALPTDAVLITGLNRWEEAPDGTPTPHNSLFVFDRSGETLAVYDKHRLVPFGEYVPLRWLFNVDKVTGGPMLDFVPGTEGVATLTRTGSVPPFSPLICYEAIYPGSVAGRGDARPQWLLNITNDAWFGQSAGPHQHLDMARMRAIEEGLPLVRVANTGITAVIDPWGRFLVETRLEEERVVDVPLPAPIAPPLFARFGNLIPATLLTLCLLTAFLCNARSRYAEIPDPALSPVPR